MPPQKPSRKIVDLRPKPPGQRVREAVRPIESFRESVPRPQKRVPLRARRRRARLIITILVLVLLVAATLGLRYASYLPQYNISTVQVTGTQFLSPDSIQSYILTSLHGQSSHFFSATNVLTFRPDPIAAGIMKFFPRVQQIIIDRNSILSTAITAHIQERAALAQWCADTNCFILDNSGFIFDAAGASTTLQETYVFHGGVDPNVNPIGQTFAQGHFPGIVVLLNMLAQANLVPLGASIENDKDFTVQLEPGFYVRASYGAAADTIIRNLKLVLDSDVLKNKQGDIEYIDLRFGDRVYYKLKGQEAKPAS